MPDADREKFLAAQAASTLIEEGMTVGLGTGSTAAHLVRILGDRVKAGLKIRALPTSVRTEQLARAVDIPIVRFEEVTRLDLTIDGADEIDPGFQIIKGGGGALLRERVVASASDRFVVVADASKQVPCLGRFPLPVEVFKFAWPLVAERLRAAGGQPTLRPGGSGSPFVTDEGNFILDCHYGRIEDPRQLAATLRSLPGVVDQGLFIDYPDVVIIGRGDSTERHDVPRTRARASP